MTLKIVETTIYRWEKQKTKVHQKRSTLTDNWGFFNVGPTELTVNDSHYGGTIEADKPILVRTNHHLLETSQVELIKPGDFFHHEFRQNTGLDNPLTSSITHKIHVRKVIKPVHSTP